MPVPRHVRHTPRYHTKDPRENDKFISSNRYDNLPVSRGGRYGHMTDAQIDAILAQPDPPGAWDDLDDLDVDW